MPETVLRDIVVLHRFYLATRLSHVGVDVDRPSYPLHRPSAYGCQMRLQSSLFDTALLLLGCQALLEGAAIQVGLHTMVVRLGYRVLGQAPPCPIALYGAVQDSDHRFPRVRDPLGRVFCSSGEGSSPRWSEPTKGDSALVRGDPPAAVVTTLIMRVLVEEPLRPDLKGLESCTLEPPC
jgi:hypothetical protein